MRLSSCKCKGYDIELSNNRLACRSGFLILWGNIAPYLKNPLYVKMLINYVICAQKAANRLPLSNPVVDDHLRIVK